MELRNYEPAMLKLLLDTVKLKVRDFLICGENEDLKRLIKWQVDIELALNDSMFKEMELPFDASEPKHWHLNAK